MLVPTATRVAVLVNPANAAIAETTLRDVEAAARAMGLQIHVLNASTNREIDAAFATFVRERVDALFVGGDPFFNSRRVQFVVLTARQQLPCWPRAFEGEDRQAFAPLLALSVFATVYLIYIGAGGVNVGVLLWPAAAAHLILAVLLARAWMSRRVAG